MKERIISYVKDVANVYEVDIRALRKSLVYDFETNTLFVKPVKMHANSVLFEQVNSYKSEFKPDKQDFFRNLVEKKFGVRIVFISLF